MGQKDNLFELIKVLSKSEKRYFKLKSENKPGSNYIKLFNAMEIEKSYNEPEFLKKYSAERFIKNFSYNKNYLYNEILSKLSEYSSGKSIDMQLRSLINHADILFNKGLYQQCKKILDKAEAMAAKYEKFVSLLEILRLKHNIRSIYENTNERLKFIENNYKTRYSIIDKITNYLKYQELSAKLITLHQLIGNSRSPKELKRYENIVNHPYTKDYKNALTFQSKYYYLYINYYYSYMKNEYKKSFDISKKLVDLVEQYPHMQNEFHGYYTVALHNVLIFRRYLTSDNEFRHYLLKYRNTKISYALEMMKNIIDSYSAEIGWYIENLNFIKAQKAKAKFIEILKSNNKLKSIPDYYYLAYNIANLEFMTGNFEESLKWLNEVFLVDEKYAGHYLYSLAKILNLLVHYELGNVEHLQYSVISALRFFYKHGRVYGIEKIVFDFLRKSLKNISTDRLIHEFEIILKKLEKLTEDEFERKVLDDLDLISWLESKIKGKPLIEILKSKVSSGS